ncbi:MAG: formate dehydrogenase accessory protein FdhE [Acidobacteria bacterium]|nr:formate dehydrogenase accessory protein FdhE [Acidobacteriota bacterium]
MSPESRWDERIARARALAASRPAAAEALIFYAAVADYQKSLAASNAALDLDPILDRIPDFLSWLPRVAPARLRESVAEMRGFDRARWRHLLHSYLAGHGSVCSSELWTSVRLNRVRSDRPVREDTPNRGLPASEGRDVEDTNRAEGSPPFNFVLEALLQPFAEQSANRSVSPALERGSSRCPFCGGLPVVGVLREEGQGARRALICGLCLTEREYVRVVCPGCGEQQFEVLPVYTADQFASVRIEACDRCHRYLKTIDLSKDGLAVPIVDDIASVSLDLWARQRGYVRLRANLLGL